MRNVLIALLFLTTLGATIMGSMFMANALSAVHEIEALICFLISAVGMTGWSISIALDKMIEQNNKLLLDSIESKARTTGGS